MEPTRTSQQLSVFGEDGKSVGGNGVEDQTQDTERSKADDPGNYLGQSVWKCHPDMFLVVSLAARIPIPMSTAQTRTPI